MAATGGPRAQESSLIPPRTLPLMVAAIAATAIVTAVPFGDAQAAPTTRTTARVIRWVDGDTVHTTKGEVRLIGMDTPERGQRCYRQAGANAARLAPAGSTITLVKVGGRDNTDRYGRLLRYVQRGQDRCRLPPDRAGLRRRGLRLGQLRHPSPPGPVPPRGRDAPRPDLPALDTAPDAATAASASNCDPSYAGVCIPPSPPDLDCGDITARRFRVVGTDPHGFDGDGDGIGCESD